MIWSSWKCILVYGSFSHLERSGRDEISSKHIFQKVPDRFFHNVISA